MRQVAMPVASASTDTTVDWRPRKFRRWWILLALLLVTGGMVGGLAIRDAFRHAEIDRFVGSVGFSDPLVIVRRSQACQDYLRTTGWSAIVGTGIANYVDRNRIVRLSVSRRLQKDEIAILGQMTSLEELSLYKTALSPELNQALRELRGLKRLELHGSQATDETVVELAWALARCDQLNSLNLGITELTPAGLKELATAKSLQAVSLRSSYLTNRSGSDGWAFVPVKNGRWMYFRAPSKK